jgi:hypothetical protein
LPGTTTSKQTREVAVKFLHEHPELRSNDGYSLVDRALIEASSPARTGHPMNNDRPPELRPSTFRFGARNVRFHLRN